MTWRARFSRESPAPLAIEGAIVILACAAFYAISVWAISVIWPPIKPTTTVHSGSIVLLIRQSDGGLRLVRESDEGFRNLMWVSSGDPAQKASVTPEVTIEVLPAAKLARSSSLRRVTLSFKEGPRYDAQPSGSGWPLRDAERIEILRHIQAADPTWLPPELRTSAGLTAIGSLGEGVRHNTARATALIVALGAAAFGLWRIARNERRYRRWALRHCAHCGYSLAGLKADICPECGHAREQRH